MLISTSQNLWRSTSSGVVFIFVIPCAKMIEKHFLRRSTWGMHSGNPSQLTKLLSYLITWWKIIYHKFPLLILWPGMARWHCLCRPEHLILRRYWEYHGEIYNCFQMQRAYMNCKLFLFFCRRGKFAVVKKCVELLTGKEYAAKFLRKRRKGEDCRSDIINEIAILEMARFSPYVVDLHEVFETNSEIILVME